MLKLRRAAIVLLVSAMAAIVPLDAFAQSTQIDSAIVVTPNFTADRFVPKDTRIELTLSRLPSQPEGAVAVMIGTEDRSALFEQRGNQLVYRAGVVPLPSGPSDVTIYLVTHDAWKEIGRFPLKVLSSLGFTSSSVTPSLSTNNSGQLAEGRSGEQPPAEAPKFGDVQATTGLRTSHVRGGWTLSTQENAVGATNRRQALRFNERGSRAPQVDLSDYVVTLERAGAKLSLGNTTFGSNRHLMNGFASRGVTMTLGVPAVSLSLGALGGSPIVGWDDPIGLARPEHRMSGASLAFEARPQRPGALHLDFTLMRGSLLPKTGFTQNAVTDAEKSTGAGVQLAASTPSQRLHFAGGFAMSRFDNPNDPLLSRGATTVPVVSAHKRASYLESSLGVLQNTKITKSLSASLTAGWHFERVDPLYRSVGVTSRADILSNVFDANGSIGPVAIQASHTRSHDNLGHINSILETFTHATTAQAAFPLGGLLHVHTPGAFWPTLSYAFNQMHQFGAGVPVNSTFTASDIPDQVSTIHDASAQWQGGKWHASYSFHRAFQDNRQSGQEANDLSATNNVAGFGVTVVRSLDVGLDLSLERQNNLGSVQLGTVKRLGFNGNWKARTNTTFSGNLSTSLSDDDPRTQRLDNTEGRLEMSRAIGFLRSRQSTHGQLFVRFAKQAANTLRFLQTDPFRDRARREGWTLVSGLNLQLL